MQSSGRINCAFKKRNPGHPSFTLPMRHRFLCTSCTASPRCERAAVRSIVCQAEFPAQGKNLGIRNTIELPLAYLDESRKCHYQTGTSRPYCHRCSCSPATRYFHPAQIFFDFLHWSYQRLCWTATSRLRFFRQRCSRNCSSRQQTSSRLFHGLTFIEAQCEIGVIPSGQTIAVERIAEIIATRKRGPTDSSGKALARYPHTDNRRNFGRWRP